MNPSPDETNLLEFEDNVLTYHRHLIRSLDGTFSETGPLIWFATGRAYYPRFNGVLRTLVPPGQDLASVMAPALEHFRVNHLPFFWSDYPPGGAPGLADCLRGLPGFRGVYPLPAMGRSLVDLPEQRLAQEIRVAQLRTLQQQAEWLEVFMEGFQNPEPTRPDYKEFLRRSVADPLYRFNHYLAYWQGVPCATASVLRASQAAGLYHVTTLPAYRGRGLGTAVTRAAMDAARLMGYDRMVLFATSDGYPVYQRLGYVAGVSVDLYINMSSGPDQAA